MSFMLYLSSIAWSLCLVYTSERLDCKDAVNKTEIECCFPMCNDNVIGSECEKFCPKNFYISESTGNIHCSPLGSIISDRNETENIPSILCIHCGELCNRTIADSQSAIGIAIIAVSLAVLSLLVSFIIVLVYLYHHMQRRRRKQLQELRKAHERHDDIQNDKRTELRKAHERHDDIQNDKRTELRKAPERHDDIQNDKRTVQQYSTYTNSQDYSSTSETQSMSSVETGESCSSSYCVSSDIARTSTVTCESCASLREIGEPVKEISGVLNATNDSVKLDNAKNTSPELPRGSSMLYPHGRVECSDNQETKTNKAKSDIENENESIQKDEKVTLCKNNFCSANHITKMVAIQPDKIIANEIETVTAVRTTNITIGIVHNLTILSNSENVDK